MSLIPARMTFEEIRILAEPAVGDGVTHENGEGLGGHLGIGLGVTAKMGPVVVGEVLGDECRGA